MFRARLYRTERDVLVAAADEELIGRTLPFGKAEVAISAGFYGNETVSESDLTDMLRSCTVANLMGTRTVGLARRLGLVMDGNVLDLAGVPHAQMARMR